MVMKQWMLVFALLASSLISCRFATTLLGTEGTTQPEVIKHDKPDLPANTQPFIAAGCSGDNLFVMDCVADSPLFELGCDFLSVNALSSALNPPYAVAACVRRWETGEPIDPSMFKQTGCLLPLYQSTVVSVEGEFRLVNDPADFQELFAPIESANEALAFAVLVSGLNARYGMDSWEIGEDSPYNFRVDRLEDTHVIETDEGFLVSLFSDAEPACGCGTHTIYQRDMLVRADGQVEIVNTTPVYDFEACID
jgi:hypothetical protein